MEVFSRMNVLSSVCKTLINEDEEEEITVSNYPDGDTQEEEDLPYDDDYPNDGNDSDPTTDEAFKDPNSTNEAGTDATEDPDNTLGQQMAFQQNIVNDTTSVLQASTDAAGNPDNTFGQQMAFQENVVNNTASVLQASTDANPNLNPINDSSIPDQTTTDPPPQGQQPQQVSDPRGYPGVPPQPQQQQQQQQQQQMSALGPDPNQMGVPPPRRQPCQTSDPRKAPTMDPVTLGLVPRGQVQTSLESVTTDQSSSQSRSQSGRDMAAPTPEQDAIHLHDAFKGNGCDVGRVVNILSHRNVAHRMRIKEEYSNKFAEELIDRLSSELSGNLKGSIHELLGLNISLDPTGSLASKFSCNIKRAVSMWMFEEAERDAIIVCQGLTITSLDLAAVTEVLCSRTPSQIKNLKRAYFNKYSSQLLNHIDSFTSPVVLCHKALLIACLAGGREEGIEVDMKKAEDDAKQLYKDGEKRWGTNEKTFIDVFTQSNRPQLAATDSAYQKLYGHSLEKAVKKEVSKGHFRDGLMTLLRCAKNPAKYFAKVLHKAMKGMGTSDTILIRVVVTRAEIDMEKIKEEFGKKYKTSLKDRVHKETSGHYRTFLLSLIEPDPTLVACS